MASSLLAGVLLFGNLLSGVAAATVPDKYGNEHSPIYWYNLAEEELGSALKDRQLGVAKNVILFLGDGMGVSTVTAGRILAGQKLGKLGEEHKLSFDNFPSTGFSKTYNTDSQITDSAASGTAYLCGVKTNQGLLGLNSHSQKGNCSSSKDAHVDSILRWSAQAGKSTGIVTTTRVTHATPAAAYSHTVDRDWESDRMVPGSEKNCEDIALQLITRNSDINVIMGGGRAYFIPENNSDPNPDPSYNTTRTSRIDGRNLIDEWRADKDVKKVTHKFVYDKIGFDQVDVAQTDYLLGLFKQGHMSYEIDRNATNEPSLAEMVKKAIGILSKNSKGFFLLAEGGRIDQGHHESKASKSLNDLVAFADAVEMAMQLTSKSDTLIVVTADHSHVFNIAGYASRGTPILGTSDINGKPSLDAMDNMPYTTLVYGNGPGYNSTRQNLTDVDTQNKDYIYQSAVPKKAETHGGEDVGIYAAGPHSFIFNGVHEQSYIPIAMAYISCVGQFGEGKKLCAKQDVSKGSSLNCKDNNNAPVIKSSTFMIALILTMAFQL